MTMLDRLKGAVFLPVGIVLLIAAGFAVKSTQEFVQRSQLAAGLIITEPYGPHHVEVRFRTMKGKVVTYHQNGAVTLHTGEAVMVRYDPGSPTRSLCRSIRCDLGNGRLPGLHGKRVRGHRCVAAAARPLAA